VGNHASRSLCPLVALVCRRNIVPDVGLNAPLALVTDALLQSLLGSDEAGGGAGRPGDGEEGLASCVGCTL